MTSVGAGSRRRDLGTPDRRAPSPGIGSTVRQGRTEAPAPSAPCGPWSARPCDAPRAGPRSATPIAAVAETRHRGPVALPLHPSGVLLGGGVGVGPGTQVTSMFHYSPGGQLAVKMTGEVAEPSLSTVEAAPMAAAANAAPPSSPRIIVPT